MGQPHKHAALIKAWADGAEIQCYVEGTIIPYWRDVPQPNWYEDTIYRIKPKTIKYRLALLANSGDKYYVYATNSEGVKEDCRFIKWLGDWQEVVVG